MSTVITTPFSGATTSLQAAFPPTECSPAVSSVQTVRVLHVVNGEHFSGAERVQSHLGRCLPAFGVTADFACLKPGRFADLLDEHGSSKRESWGRGFRVPMRSRLDRSVVPRLVRLVGEHGYELLHAHTPRSAMVTDAVARQTGLPWVYHVHSPAARDCSKRLHNRINAWIERRALRHCAHQITVSNSLKRDLLSQGFHDRDVTVVHNGVPAVRPPRTHVPTVGGPWTIGMIALMRPRKGLEVALRALAELSARGVDNVTLRCIGPFETPAYRHCIDSLIDQLQLGPKIDWVGFTQDVPGELAKLDAMLLPSLYGEGLPMVVLEAMAAAVPVIATEVEGTPEAIRHGVEGLLAIPQDPISLADQIETLVRGGVDWDSMAEAAASRHGESFSDTAMAEQTAAVYRRLV